MAALTPMLTWMAVAMLAFFALRLLYDRHALRYLALLRGRGDDGIVAPDDLSRLPLEAQWRVQTRHADRLRAIWRGGADEPEVEGVRRRLRLLTVATHVFTVVALLLLWSIPVWTGGGAPPGVPNQPRAFSGREVYLIAFGMVAIAVGAAVIVWRRRFTEACLRGGVVHWRRLPWWPKPTPFTWMWTEGYTVIWGLAAIGFGVMMTATSLPVDAVSAGR